MPADLQHARASRRRVMPAALAVSSIVGSRPSSLQQLLGDVAQLRHRLDHVHRDADGAGLVGDGAGDRLANPPGGVGRELVAAAIFVLVDRPHQAGVAFLDQVEEGQAAVAVLLGDRDDQPQVAARQLALGVLVFGEALADRLHALAAGMPGSSSVISIRSRSSFSRLARSSRQPRWPSRTSDLPFQLVHAIGDLLQLLHQRLHALGADRQLLDQRRRPCGGASSGCGDSRLALLLAQAFVEAAW